jgi:hypothetical protein
MSTSMTTVQFLRFTRAIADAANDLERIAVCDYALFTDSSEVREACVTALTGGIDGAPKSQHCGGVK